MTGVQEAGGNLCALGPTYLPMSGGNHRGPGEPGNGPNATIQLRRVAPGKRTLSQRLPARPAGDASREPPDPTETESAAPAVQAMVGPGWGSPIPPVDELRASMRADRDREATRERDETDREGGEGTGAEPTAPGSRRPGPAAA